MAHHAVTKQITRALGRGPALVRALHFKRNGRLQIFASEARAGCARRRLDGSLIPPLRREWHRYSYAQGVVLFPQRRERPGRCKPVLILKACVVVDISRRQGHIRVGLRFSEGRLRLTLLFPQTGAPQVGPLSQRAGD